MPGRAYPFHITRQRTTMDLKIISEEAFITCERAHRLGDQFVPEDIEIFEEYLKKYFNS